MPTAQELAKERETRKLALAGLDQEGNPLLDADGNPIAPNGNGNGNDAIGNDDSNDDDDDAATMRQRILDLERQLVAANGRAVPSQQQADEYRRLWQQEVTSRQQEQSTLQEQIDSLRTQLESTPTAFDVDSVLNEEEQAAIDPALMQTVIKLADAIATRKAPKIDVRTETLRALEEREASKVTSYRNRILNDPARGLHQLGALSTDPEFTEWLQEDDNDMDSVVNSLLAARSTEEVDRYAKIVAKRIVKFKERTKPPIDTRTSLGQHMRRSPKQKLTEAEVQAKVNEAKQLARSRNPADRQKAQQILNDLP